MRFQAFYTGVVLLIASPSFAHSGGTNADGCHTNSKTGDYHCHAKKNAPSQPTKVAPPKNTQNTPAPLVPTSTHGGNTRIDSFNRSKKSLMSNVYFDHLTTFYCDNPFTVSKKIISTPSKYTPKRANSRAQRIEWEHVVPAHAFGQAFPEWRNGHPNCTSKGKPFKGRNCASKMNMQFRHMEADMHNLVPAIGEVNGNRSNYSFAMIPGEAREYGACDIEISGRKAEPRPQVRGDIARTYFYMHKAYPGRGVISSSSRKLFEAWDKLDPVDPWECERNRRIATIQGNDNPFVSQRCQ